MMRIVCLLVIYLNLLTNEASLFEFTNLKSSKLIDLIRTSNVETTNETPIHLNLTGGSNAKRLDENSGKWIATSRNDSPNAKQTNSNKSDLKNDASRIQVNESNSVKKEDEELENDSLLHQLDQIDPMLNDDFNIEPEDHVRRLNDILQEYSSSDIDEQSNDEESEFRTEIRANFCEKDNCRSANQTNSAYRNVDCQSINNDYKCFYCPSDRILIRHKHRCAGPCHTEQECDKLKKLHNTHVKCSHLYGYREDENDPSLCIKERQFSRTEPLSISYFYPEISTNLTSTTNKLNRTLVHQIDLTKIEDICKFEMKIEQIDDLKPNGEQQFEMEMKDKKAHFYLNSSSSFQTGLVSIECLYRQFILHRTEIHLNKDKFSNLNF